MNHHGVGGLGREQLLLPPGAGETGPVGYVAGVGFLGHSVAATNEGLKALIAEAREFSGPGFLLPSRNAELVRWCLGRRLRIVHTMTLMTIGLYNEPSGAWLPSVLF